MKFLKSFFDFYIYSNIHVALAAFSLVKITLLDFNIHENTSPIFVFFATFLSYNFIRSYKIKEIDIFSMSWITSHKNILIFLNLISIVFLIILTFNIRFLAFLILIPFALATFFYIVPFRIDNKNLRSIASLKLFLIAITWAGTTVLFPLFQNDLFINSEVMIIFLQRFLFIFALIIPFDIRDIQVDHNQLKTIPQIFGVIRSKIISGIALILFLMLEFLKMPSEKSEVYDMVLLALISFLWVLFSKEDQSRYYTTFWIEALPIFWLFLVFF